MQMKKISLDIAKYKGGMPLEKSRQTENSSGECQKNNNHS